MARLPDCLDCRADGHTQRRPTPYPGPRCTTHHRAVLKARSKAAHDRRVQRTYGLGPGDYDSLYLYQGGRCAVCRVATGARKRLAVDHDHKTGAVRGLLCGPCNQMLGQLRDNADAFARAAEYLHNPPARVALREAA